MTTKRLKKKLRVRRMVDGVLSVCPGYGMRLSRREAARRVRAYLRLVKAKAVQKVRAAVGDIPGLRIRARHVVD